MLDFSLYIFTKIIQFLKTYLVHVCSEHGEYLVNKPVFKNCLEFSRPEQWSEGHAESRENAGLE